MYEMTAQCLLLPMSRGVPTWRSELDGEKETIKLPKQFAALFGDSPQLTEDIGEAMAKWAAGSKAAVKMSAEQLIAEYAACSEPSELRRLGEIGKASWSSFTAAEKPSVKAASETAAKRIEEAAKAPEPTPTPASADEDEFNPTQVAS